MEFPKWKYHADKPACIVQTPEAEAKLGAGWVDSPADIKKQVEKDPEEQSEVTEKAAAKLPARLKSITSLAQNQDSA